jgi:GntR family transcriptional regulator, rspAB operon transcriptional repressor
MPQTAVVCDDDRLAMSNTPAVLSQTRLDRRRPMRDQIYPLIRDMILTGVIKPGDPIDEKAIAAELSISRTPVREAVKKLSDEHLVDVVAQSGTRAAQVDAREIEQAYLIRRSLEMETAFQAASRMNEAHAETLHENLMLHERAIEQRQFVKAISLDDNFHRAIAQIAELPRLWNMIEISKAHLDRCRHMLIPRAGQAALTLEQHRAIIRALNTKKPDSAREAMRDHLDASYGKIALLFEEQA